MKCLFIVNPVAGKGRTGEYVPIIKKHCEENNVDHVIELTNSPGHATEIAKAAQSKGFDRIYSVGGDGTVNEIVNGMVGSDISLAVVPGGSGNDFVRSIGIDPGKKRPSGSYIEKILLQLLKGRERAIDLARVNGRFFVNIASVGFDARVVESTMKFKKKPGISGSMAYVLGIISAVWGLKNYNLVLDMDGSEMRSATLLAAIANGRYYGGGMMPVPGASIDDGLLSVCHVAGQTRRRVLRLFPRYMEGSHGSIEGVSFHTCRKIVVSSDEEVPLNIDGELMRTSKAEFEIYPRAIKVVFPQTFQFARER